MRTLTWGVCAPPRPPYRRGMSDVDYTPVAQVIGDIGYDRWLSIEVFKYGSDPETIARKSIEYLRLLGLTDLWHPHAWGRMRSTQPRGRPPTLPLSLCWRHR